MSFLEPYFPMKILVTGNFHGNFDDHRQSLHSLQVTGFRYADTVVCVHACMCIFVCVCAFACVRMCVCDNRGRCVCVCAHVRV